MLVRPTWNTIEKCIMDRYRLSLHQGNIMEVVNGSVSIAVPYFTKNISRTYIAY